VIRSSDKILIKTFDQVKKHNFDQLKFDQVIVSLNKCINNMLLYVTVFTTNTTTTTLQLFDK
jgi:hypothetical protein